MAQSASPQPRSHHESALIGHELHLFGGTNAKYDYFPRNEIWTCNVQEENKWIRRIAQGKNIPPPCLGAQCVVINGIMYSYGGYKEDGGYLGEVFGLDPKKMKWIQVATPIHGKKPWQRHSCCLWAIGGRIVMFGGFSGDIRQDRLQSGAQCNGAANNEIYEFVFEEGREKGYWLDVELSGERPQPRAYAAMETIDQHRGLLHGGYDDESLDDAFVIDLREKKWICIDFLPKPSAQFYHRICRLSKEGFKERNCFILIGGFLEDHAYILDFDKRKSYAFHLNPEITPIYNHTLHCVENGDGSAQIIVTGGEDRGGEFKEIVNEFTLGPSNESYMKIETQIIPSLKLISTKTQNESLDIRELERELEEMRMEVAKLRQKRAQSHQVIEEQKRQFEEEKMQKTRLEKERSHLVEQRTKSEVRTKSLEQEKIRLIEQRSELEALCNSLRTKNRDLESEKTEVTHALEDQRTKLEIQCRDLQKENDHLKIELKAVRESHRQLIESLAANPERPHAAQASIASSETEVDRQVTDDELQRLAPYLIEKWKEVSRRLPGRKESEAALEEKYRFNPNERVYSMLNSWHNSNGSDATVRRICVALVRSPVLLKRAAENVFGVTTVKQALDINNK